MNLEELYKEAHTLCQKHWGVDYTGTIELVEEEWHLLNADIEFRKSCPTYANIRMSKPKNQKRSREDISKTLLHELVHWRLRTIGQPFRDFDKEFIQEALRVGASISMAEDAQLAFRKYGAGYEHEKDFENRSRKKP